MDTETEKKTDFFKSLITFFSFCLQLAIVICMPYLIVDTSCMAVPVELLASNVAYVFYALLFESIMLAFLVFLLWFSGCTASRRYQILFERLTYFMICVCLLSIPLAVQTTQYITKDHTRMKMFKAIDTYRDNHALTVQMDFIQSSWQCCGVDNFNDWKRNSHFNCSSQISPLCDPVPPSCRNNKDYKKIMYCTDVLRETIQVFYNLSNYKVPMNTLFQKGCIEVLDIFRYTLGFFYLKYSTILVLLSILLIGIQKVVRRIFGGAELTKISTETQTMDRPILFDPVPEKNIHDID